MPFEKEIGKRGEQDQPLIVPEPLSDYEIQMIHAGLLIPSLKSVISMSREIRKRRGDPNPDSI